APLRSGGAPHSVRAELVEALVPLAPTLRQAQGERGSGTRPAHSSASNPTVMRPSPHSTTGRLITLGCSSITRFAPAASTADARTASSSLRQVVPERFNRRSQPAAASHASSRAVGTPAFLK